MPEETTPEHESSAPPRGALARLRAWLAPLTARRRRLLASLAALLAFALLAGAPAVIASQPRFLQRYANMETEYDSWRTSTHAEVGCASCHVRPGTLARSAHAVRMVGEFYASIVAPSRQPAVFGRPANEACEQCHRDVRQASPGGDLKIPHRAHVDQLNLDCVHCHAFAVHALNPEGTHSPRMATCMECHNGRQAKSECSACHRFKDEPESHRSGDWLAVHADKQGEIDCKSCHAWTPKWCRDCHAKRPASHAGKWRTNHPAKVAAHRNCEACHKSDFCVRCHGEVPQANLNPALKYVE